MNNTTYNKILSKGIERDLPVNVGDNKLRFTTDTGRLFLDDEGLNRVEITDFVKGLTKNQILNTVAPLPKVYLSSDTYEIFVYDNTIHDWVNYGGKFKVFDLTQEEYDELSPEEKADPNKLYLIDDDTIYLTTEDIQYGTRTYWGSKSSLTSRLNTIYVYTDYRTDEGVNYPSIKIGDGVTSVPDLPFLEVDYAQTANYAYNASSAEYAISSQNADYASTASWSSWSAWTDNATSAEYAQNAENASSATFAENAYQAENADNATSASWASSAEYSINADTADYAIYAENAATADYASYAGSVDEVVWDNITDKPATYAPIIGNAATQAAAGNHNHDSTYYKKTDTVANATNASSATYATTAGSANSATNASSATYATNAASATYAGTASSANSVAWGNVSGKPSTFAPIIGNASTQAAAGNHNHDGTYLASTLKGAANGVAELGSDGKVPSSQLPSYVDDVLEYDSKNNFPATGESGKIYIAKDTNKTYRWSGTTYVEISESLALGETDSTAYRGDRGKIAYDHSQTAHAPSNAEKNQNAFSNVVVGSTTVAADTTTDTLTLAAGDNITLTPDATNDKVTIAANNTTYDLSPYQKKAEKINNAATADYATTAGSATNASSATYAGTAGSVTWGNVSGKPSTFPPSSHTHTTNMATTADPNNLTMAANTKYKLSTGGTEFNFTTPPDPTYTTNMATTADPNQLTMAANTKYKLSTGGTVFNFTTPPNPTSVSTATNASTADYAKAAPWSGISGKPDTYPPSSHTHDQYSTTAHNHDGTYYKKTDTVANATNAGTATYAGTAGTANAVAWGNVSGKPDTYPPSSHTHTTSISTYSGGVGITLALGDSYKLSTGGTAFNFKMPDASTYTTNISTYNGGTNITLELGAKYKLSTGGTAFNFEMPNAPTYTTNISTYNGAVNLDLQAGAKYKLTTGGTGFNFTMPPNPTSVSTATNASTADYAKAAPWSGISSKPDTYPPTTGSGSTQAAPGNHTHGTAIATSTGTNQLTMAANTKYAIGAGGTTFVFTTPPDNNTTYDLSPYQKKADKINNAATADYATNAGTATYAENASTSDYATLAESANAVAWSSVTGKPSTYAPVIGSGSTQAAAGNHTHSAYVNQNAFSNVIIGSTTVAADTATDTLTLVAGDNITLTPDATNDKITITAKDTTYDLSPYQKKADKINNAATADYATNTSSATYATTAGSAGSATSATSATNASTADYAKAAPWSGISSKPSTYAPIVGSGSTQAAAGNHNHDGTYYKKTDTVSNASSATYATTAGSANAVAWGNVSGKPSTYPPSAHNHDGVYLATGLKGTANGVAELDENGLVPSSQLPSFVDDVIEGYYYNSKFWKEAAHTTEITAESGKIYVDLTSGNNKTYRWSGTAYVIIASDLALGETSSTAYRGDRGKIAYDHSQSAHAPSNAEKNQNAFSNVIVGSTTVAADTATDTLTLVAGNNVTITPDATNDKITITATDTTYDLSPYQKKAEKINNAATADYATNASSATYASSAGAVAWGNVSGKPSTFAPVVGSGSTQAAAGNHTHTTTIATSTGTNQLTMAANTKYALGAGGTTYIFTTPPNPTSVTNATSAEYATNAGTATYATTAGSANAVAWGNVSGKPTTFAPIVGSGSTQAAAGNHTHSAYVNQNAFSNVIIGSTTVAADTVTDTLTLVAGDNVTLTPDATNDKITITAKDTTYDLSPYQKKAEKINNAATADYATNASSATYATTAGSANAVAWGNVSGKPSTYAPSAHTHDQYSTTAHNHDGTYYKKTDTVSNATNASSATYATTAGSANAVAWGNVSGKPSTGIATSTGTNQLTMAANTKYALGAGGTTYIFTTPPNPTSVTNATSATYATNAGTATYATTAGTANAVAWGNVSGKPSTYPPTTGSASTQAAPGNHTHTTTIATSTGTNQLSMAASTKYALGAGGTTYIFTTPADTKNTAGSTDTSSKIFLVGATSQAANPQTYSDNEVYTTSGVLTAKSMQVGGGAATIQYNSNTQSIDFVFAS